MVARIVVILLLTAIVVQADERAVAVTAKVLAVRDAKAGAPTGEIEVMGPKGSLILLVTAKTELQKRVGKQRVGATLSEVAPGDMIEVLYSGEIAASDPPRAAAYKVTILTAAK